MARGKTSESVVTRAGKYYAPEDFKKKARVSSLSSYRRLYKKSIKDPEAFWAERAEQIAWIKKWKRVLDYDFDEPRIRWFEGGKLNASYNCLDRHLETWRKNKAALVWVGENRGEERIYSYQALHR